ncbi:hypothetical protein ACTWPB_17705 [Nocardia sp. IBHARD005]|uniref:hypothetical protein n=1 Tax=Nocardia sp. IBHARD005 TaxID=3457765 RepID=UPI004058C08C
MDVQGAGGAVAAIVDVVLRRPQGARDYVLAREVGPDATLARVARTFVSGR